MTPSPRAYSPPRPRVTSPQRAWLSATKQERHFDLGIVQQPKHWASKSGDD